MKFDASVERWATFPLWLTRETLALAGAMCNWEACPANLKSPKKFRADYEKCLADKYYWSESIIKGFTFGDRTPEAQQRYNARVLLWNKVGSCMLNAGSTKWMRVDGVAQKAKIGAEILAITA